jgi:hypothetical protein
MNIIISTYTNGYGARFLASQKNIRLEAAMGIKATALDGQRRGCDLHHDEFCEE